MSDAAKPAPPQPSQDLSPRPLSLVGLVVTLLVVAAVAAGLVFWVRFHAKESAAKAQGGRGRYGQSGGMAMPVAGAKAVVGDIPITVDALGTVTPLATVTVRAQIGGVLMQIAFVEGQMVAKGAFMAQIDDRPYQAALAQAKGNLERDQALLKDARIDLDRYAQLVKSDSISHQQYDTQAALVQQDDGAVATDRAAIDATNLNIAYCRITAPVAGRVGIRQVDQGNLVQPSDANGLVVITQMDPISVIYTIPEDRLPQINRRLAAGASLPVTAYDRNEGSALAEGMLVAEDNLIDTSTGTVKMRAQFANSGGTLFPNQFVNVRMLVDTLADATVVPAAAIQQGAPGSFVYLIKPDSTKPEAMTVAMTPVKLGPATEESVAISEGLKPGDEIVTQGADRLKDGATVKVTEGAGATPSTGHHHGHGGQGSGSWHHGGSATAAATAGGGEGSEGGWGGHGGSRSGSASWVDGGDGSEPQSGTQSPHHHHHHQADDQGQGQ
jgi:multidrug efflux system membrane fusion protein